MEKSSKSRGYQHKPDKVPEQAGKRFTEALVTTLKNLRIIRSRELKRSGRWVRRGHLKQRLDRIAAITLSH